MRLILASASPQRKKLLEDIDLKFKIIPSKVDESACEELNPKDRARVLAKMKAEDVYSVNHHSFVLGVDTIVVSDMGTLLEKPLDEDDARRMMREHSGKKSTVYSAICLIEPSGKLHEALDTSVLYFRHLSDDDIELWILSGLWKDRSGAFQIEGKGQLLIERLEGDWTGVVGLPLFALGKILREII